MRMIKHYNHLQRETYCRQWTYQTRGILFSIPLLPCLIRFHSVLIRDELALYLYRSGKLLYAGCILAIYWNRCENSEFYKKCNRRVNSSKSFDRYDTALASRGRRVYRLPVDGSTAKFIGLNTIVPINGNAEARKGFAERVHVNNENADLDHISDAIYGRAPKLRGPLITALEREAENCLWPRSSG